MKGTTRNIDDIPEHLDEETVSGLLLNIETAMAELHYHQYQQIAALFSPRPGMPDSDAVPFTRITAEEAQQACKERGIKAAVIAWLEDNQQSYTVVFAKSDKGLDMAERHARKLARQRRARADIFR
jgi:hypothetical protein